MSYLSPRCLAVHLPYLELTMALEMSACVTNFKEIFLHGLTVRYPHWYLSMPSSLSASVPGMRSLCIEASRCSPRVMAKFIYPFPRLDDLRARIGGITDYELYDPPSPPSFEDTVGFTIKGNCTAHFRFLSLRFKRSGLASLRPAHGEFQ